MAGRLRRLGGGLVVLALAILAVLVPLQALEAGEQDFERLVGWANILALSVGAIGIGLWFADRWLPGAGALHQHADGSLDELASQVLDQESRQRAALLGTDSPSTVAANLRYDRLIQFQHVDGKPGGDLVGIGDFYLHQTGGRMVILGSPGAGKTVLSLELLVQLLERRRKCTDPVERASIPVPIRLNLPSWNTDQPFTTWLMAQLRTQYGMADSMAGTLVQQRRILPILDGLDEMDASDGDPARARTAVDGLNQYLDGRSGAPLVVACRSADYARLSETIRPAVQIGIQPLTASQIRGYLSRHREADDRLAPWQAWQPLLAALDRGDALLSQVNTPWRMMLAVTFHRDGGDLNLLLPRDTEDDSAYARRVSELLLERFIPARTRLCEPGRYRPEQVGIWMRNIADHLAWQSGNGMSGTDLVLHEWWRIAGDSRVRRRHGIAAAVLVGLWFILAILTIGDWDAQLVVRVVHVNLRNFTELSGRSMAGLLGLLLSALAVPVWAFLVGRQASCQPRQISLQQVRTFQGRRRLVRDGVSGLGVGMAVGLGIATSGVAMEVNLATTLAVGLPVGLLLGFVAGLAFGLSPIDVVGVNPHDPLRNDTFLALACGLAGVVGGALTDIPGFGLMGALVGWLTGMLGGHASLRYVIAVALAARAGTGPFLFRRFLKWAYRAGFLRISGSAYQIRHNELRDWLQQRSRQHDTAVAALDS